LSAQGIERVFKELDYQFWYCLGHQVMRRLTAGAVRTRSSGGYAAIEIEILEENDILKGLGHRQTYGRLMPMKLQ